MMMMTISITVVTIITVEKNDCRRQAEQGSPGSPDFCMCSVRIDISVLVKIIHDCGDNNVEDNVAGDHKSAQHLLTSHLLTKFY